MRAFADVHLHQAFGGDIGSLLPKRAADDLQIGEQTRTAAGEPVGAEPDEDTQRQRVGRSGRLAVEPEVALGRLYDARILVAVPPLVPVFVEARRFPGGEHVVFGVIVQVDRGEAG